MQNLYIYCEGQTEEAFVKSCLLPYFINKDIYLYPIICRTKEGPDGIFKGGLVDYNKAVKEIKKICTQHTNEKVTSFIDFYGLNNIPNVDGPTVNQYEIIEKIEQRFFDDVNCRNFIPYMSMHEFESILFTDPNQFSYLSDNAVRKFSLILREFNDNPELINSSKDTAPSRRIKREIVNYRKPVDGIIIAKKLTLNEIRGKCKHFNDWIVKLENL